ncbi:hypothetical protein QYE76_013086 [Lolium multiflorum]|uniref:CCHC-type domain-containing protein n=1 Tax=Lolium multiflorum TaxID=4521 RepID=A0AAD8U385_LOLMU|nr:hypothetical protein QYE76_013086 [Lolium multiflorum]
MQMLQLMMEDREAERAERQANITALQQLAQNNQGRGNHDHPGSKLKNFQNTNPPMFSKTEEPLDADDWLQTIENNLEVAGVEAAEKVLFATHYLSGPARAWWTSARAMNAGQMMTWEDFKLKFSKYHVPQGLIKKMRDEFRELKQGRMSVVEYRDRFLTLSRYAPDETDTNEKRKERFLNGLHDEMQTVMMNQSGPHHTQKHRNNSSGGFTPRNNRPPAQTYRTNNNGGPPKPGGNHHNNNNHNNNGNNTNTNTGPRTGSNAIPVTPKDKSTINCYECGVVGHYSKECPKKLAKIAANTAAPAQQQRRFAGRRNQNNNNGRFYHMTATEAQEAPQTLTTSIPLKYIAGTRPALDHAIGRTPPNVPARGDRARHVSGRARARRRAIASSSLSLPRNEHHRTTSYTLDMLLARGNALAIAMINASAATLGVAGVRRRTTLRFRPPQAPPRTRGLYTLDNLASTISLDRRRPSAPSTPYLAGAAALLPSTMMTSTVDRPPDPTANIADASTGDYQEEEVFYQEEEEEHFDHLTNQGKLLLYKQDNTLQADILASFTLAN